MRAIKEFLKPNKWKVGILVSIFVIAIVLATWPFGGGIVSPITAEVISPDEGVISWLLSLWVNLVSNLPGYDLDLWRGVFFPLLLLQDLLAVLLFVIPIFLLGLTAALSYGLYYNRSFPIPVEITAIGLLAVHMIVTIIYWYILSCFLYIVRIKFLNNIADFLKPSKYKILTSVSIFFVTSVLTIWILTGGQAGIRIEIDTASPIEAAGMVTAIVFVIANLILGFIYWYLLSCLIYFIFTKVKGFVLRK